MAYKRTKNYDGPYDMVRVYLPKWLAIKLNETRAALKQPVSRLVGIAIDNEMRSTSPFNYPVEIPTTPAYLESAYIAEAQRMIEFIKKNPIGIDRELLVMSRGDYGIESIEVALLVLRELFMVEMVREVSEPRKRGQVYLGRKVIILITAESDQRDLAAQVRLDKLKLEAAKLEKRLADRKNRWKPL